MNSRVILILSIPFLVLAPVRGQDDPVQNARRAMDAGKVQEALKELESNYDKVKDNVEALVILAQCTVRTRQFGKAMDYSLRALEKDRSNGPANKIAGIAFYNKGMEAATSGRATSGQVQGLFEEAGTFLEAALVKAPKDVEMWGLRGECLWRANDPDAAAEAARSYEKAIELEPRNIKWQTGAVRAYQLAGDQAGALKCLDASLARQPGSAELLLLRGDVYRTSDPARLDEAIASYREALKAPDLKEPHDATVANHIWGLLGAKNRMDEALVAVTEWKQAHPKNFNAHWWVGYYALQLKQTDAALSAFKEAFEVSGKKHGGTAVWVGECLTRKGELKQAAEWMVKGAKLQEEWARVEDSPIGKILAIARSAFLEKGQLEEGIKFLEKYGVEADDTNVWLYNNLGLAYRDLVDMKRSQAKELSLKSARYYEKACEAVLIDSRATATDKAQIFNDTGILYHFPKHRINDVAKAVSLYRKALAFSPDYIDALENLGLCMNILGKYEEAVPLFKKVLERQPGRLMSRRGLGKAEEGLKK